jgi:hypothetical protein
VLAKPAGIENAAFETFRCRPCVAHAEAATAAQRFIEFRVFKFWWRLHKEEKAYWKKIKRKIGILGGPAKE